MRKELFLYIVSRLFLMLILILMLFFFGIAWSLGRQSQANNDDSFYQSRTCLEPIQEVADVEIVKEVEERKPIKTLKPEPSKEFLGMVRVTAYCPCSKCCGEWADGNTYTGTKATANRTIAVDPDVIPLGTKVEIDGREYIAEDIGGAVDGERVDIFFNSHEEALEWGVQYHGVFIFN